MKRAAGTNRERRAAHTGWPGEWRVARALGALPKIDVAFAAGRLSYAQVRAITRIATAANEDPVLELALAATGAQLERICRGFRKATAVDVEAASARCVRARTLGDGMVRLELVVSADEADLVMKAIESARRELSPAPAKPDPAVKKSAPRAPRATAADAVMHMVQSYLAPAQPDTDSGKLGPGHAEILIHVDHELTSHDGALTAKLEDGTHVSAETLRRVACRRHGLRAGWPALAGHAPARRGRRRRRVDQQRMGLGPTAVDPGGRRMNDAAIMGRHGSGRP